ncbi:MULTISPECIES: sensor histidine kinase [unclassified Sphingomonas]|uniref:sensor histidine kinase n=1 Tax=unclassified Sphingomonas TaxID=196159 RepID=UPI000A7902EE|nr:MULTISPECIES: histidine kinase dimerization/phosphoacceptor domain -containing protein [unclassified Sphingomonas]
MFERFPLGRGQPLLAYGTAIGISIVALVIRLLSGGLMPDGYPYVAFFPAVIVSTFLFGVGPGVTAAVLCGVMARYFFMPPRYSFGMSGGIVVALFFYALVVTIDIVLIDWMQRTNRRLAAERERSRQLAERGEILFRELQHRVSNNLQVVGGLLALQMKGISDTAARLAMEEASRRLSLIGRIHRQLYDPHGEQVDLGLFLEQLGADLIDAGGKPGVACRVEAEADLPLSPDAAVPIALIVAEAVANAIEHGFAGREGGEILIRASRAHDGTLDLRVIDDGIGLPADFDLARSDSLGLKLAQMLARQLGGTFRLFVDGRTTAMLRLS